MDYSKTSPDWSLLRAFYETVQAGSFSAASRTLGVSQPTLSRQVAALEAELDVMLFERVGRGLSLTEAGNALLPHAERMAAAAAELGLSASALGSDLSGPVRITASHVYAALLLPPILRQIKDVSPGLRPMVVATDDISDLMRREADIALRHVRPQEPDLVARLVCESTGHFYASKSYLARVRRPTTKEDLARLDWISADDDARFLKYMQDFGIPLESRALQSGSQNGMACWEMAKAGLGVCPMDRRIAAKNPEMEALLPERFAIRFPVWLVTHREIHTSAKIRLVFDMLADALTDTEKAHLI